MEKTVYLTLRQAPAPVRPGPGAGLLREWFGFVRFLGFLRLLIPDGREVLGCAVVTGLGCAALVAAGFAPGAGGR